MPSAKAFQRRKRVVENAVKDTTDLLRRRRVVERLEMKGNGRSIHILITQLD